MKYLHKNSYKYLLMHIKIERFIAKAYKKQARKLIVIYKYSIRYIKNIEKLYKKFII